MKIINTQQEVLLVTDTGFASRQYTDKDYIDNSKNLSEREKELFNELAKITKN